jgi:uncharacterized membrane protein YphA (DoxX/SURF4 family)
MTGIKDIQNQRPVQLLTNFLTMDNELKTVKTLITMKTLSQLRPWLPWEYPRWLNFVRMALGLFFTFKGVSLMFHLGTADFGSHALFSPFIDMTFYHIVIFVHFVGGIMLSIGYNTRLVAIAQLPILFFAFFMIKTDSTLIVWSPEIEFTLSFVAFVITGLFVILGSGEISVDNRVK